MTVLGGSVTGFEGLTKPVWMVRGMRGDFVDYHLKKYVEHRPNWTIEVLPSLGGPATSLPDGEERMLRISA